jgi:lysophospholipase L1-like esterase
MKNRLIKYVALPVLSIAVFVIVLESALQLLAFDPHPKGRDFIVNRAPDYPEAFLKDHDLFWRLRPDQIVESEFFEGKSYRINEQGFRGDDFRTEKNGLRVAVLGNSCSFGWGIDDDDTFARRLERMLSSEANLEAAEVYNFSVPGYSSYQGKINYRENVHPYSPDIIIVKFGWNDQWLSADNMPDKAREMPPQALLDLSNVVSRLRFYRWLRGIFHSGWSPGDTIAFSYDNTRVSLSDFKKNLGEIIDLARADGAAVILLTSPMPAAAPPKKEIEFQMHRHYNDMVRETAATYNTSLVDLAAVFTRYDSLFDDPTRDPYHYNARGHAIAADAIFPMILSMTE